MTTLLNPSESEMKKLFKEQVQDRVERPSVDEMRRRAKEHETLVFVEYDEDTDFRALNQKLKAELTRVLGTQKTKRIAQLLMSGV